MAKGSGTTRTAKGGATATVSKGSIYDVEGGKEFVDEMKKLASEYGLPIDIEIIPRDNGAFADAHQPLDGRLVVGLHRVLGYQKEDKYGLPHNVGANNENVATRMRAVAAHEFAHQLAQGYNWLPEQGMTWEQFKLDERKRGFKVAEAKQHYEGYLKRREQALLRRVPLEKHRKMLKQLNEVEKSYNSEKDGSKKLSNYAKNNGGSEFVAEAYAFARVYGKGKNPYADKVYSIINKYRK